MARPSLDKNVKFRRLVRILDEPKPHVIGYLESLWQVAYECGNPVIGDPEAVEAAIEYPGEPGKLFHALMSAGGRRRTTADNGAEYEQGQAGFIEEVPGEPGRYQIHDLYDHAPDYVKKRKQREDERKQRTYVDSADNGGQRPSMADNVRTPTPTPAHKEERTTTSEADVSSSSSIDDKNEEKKRTKHTYPEAFELWWNAYPKERRTSKHKTLAMWIAAGKRVKVEQDLDNVAAADFLLTQVRAFAASPAAADTQFVKEAHRWLSYGSYDDPPEAWQEKDTDQRQDDESRIHRPLRG